MEMGLEQKALESIAAAREKVREGLLRASQSCESALLSLEMRALILNGQFEDAQKLISAVEHDDDANVQTRIEAAFLKSSMPGKASGDDPMDAFEAAMKHLDKVDADRAHVKAQIQMYKGKLYVQMRILDLAEASFQAAVDLDPHNLHMKTCLLRTLCELERAAKSPGESKRIAERLLRVAKEIQTMSSRHGDAKQAIVDAYERHGLQ
jgi:hypothetical protein